MSPLDGAGRIMPQSMESEIAVLGAILISPNETLDRCIQMLTPECFYQRSHQIVYSTCLAMHEKGEPVDVVTVTTRLKDAGKLDEIGGAYYVTKLSTSLPTAAHTEFYLGILREKHQLRRLIETATAAIQTAYDSQDEVARVMDRVETDILKICEENPHKEVESIKEITDRMVAKVSEMHEHRGKLPGLSWGFRDLNELTFGLRPAEMVVLAARPGIGKTSLALNVAEKLLEESIPVGFFSLEMTAEQLALRMACSKARVNMWNIYHGNVETGKMHDFTRAAANIGNSPLHVLDSSQTTIGQLRAAARRMKSRHDIKILMIDYLQLIVGSSVGRNDNREREVAVISGGIKSLAKELDIPVLILCQLNRAPDRENREPKLSDLRESGAIEQDADIVCLMARKDAYDETSGRPEKSVVADVMIRKNRNGPVGQIELTFFPEYTRFEDHTPVEGG